VVAACRCGRYRSTSSVTLTRATTNWSRCHDAWVSAHESLSSGSRTRVRRHVELTKITPHHRQRPGVERLTPDQRLMMESTVDRGRLCVEFSFLLLFIHLFIIFDKEVM